jgi:hypothetical protein
MYRFFQILAMLVSILSGGRPLFASGLPELPLRLLGAKSFPSGLVQLQYARM